jgi:hypothetical protein
MNPIKEYLGVDVLEFSQSVPQHPPYMCDVNTIKIGWLKNKIFLRLLCLLICNLKHQKAWLVKEYRWLWRLEILQPYVNFVKGWTDYFVDQLVLSDDTNTKIYSDHSVLAVPLEGKIFVIFLVSYIESLF